MKTPAFQFYPQDFLSSPDVQMMTTQEIGAYCLLLFNAWIITDRPGYLPNNERKLQRLTKLNVEEWDKIKDVVLEKFKTSECGNFIYNKRLVDVCDKQEIRRLRLAANGSKGGRPSKPIGLEEPPKEEPKNNLLVNSSKPNDKQEERLSSSSSSSSSSSDILLEKESKGDGKIKLSDFEKFELIVKTYPGTKRTPKTEWTDFKNKFKTEISTEFLRGIWNGIQTKSKTNKELEKAGGFVPEWPHLKTYLNQRRWEEETEVKATPIHREEPKPYYTQTQEEQDNLFGGLSEFGRRQRELERNQSQNAA